MLSERYRNAHRQKGAQGGHTSVSPPSLEQLVSGIDEPLVPPVYNPKGSYLATRAMAVAVLGTKEIGPPGGGMLAGPLTVVAQTSTDWPASPYVNGVTASPPVGGAPGGQREYATTMMEFERVRAVPIAAGVVMIDTPFDDDYTRGGRRLSVRRSGVCLILNPTDRTIEAGESIYVAYPTLRAGDGAVLEADSFPFFPIHDVHMHPAAVNTRTDRTQLFLIGSKNMRTFTQQYKTAGGVTIAPLHEERDLARLGVAISRIPAGDAGDIKLSPCI